MDLREWGIGIKGETLSAIGTIQSKNVVFPLSTVACTFIIPVIVSCIAFCVFDNFFFFFYLHTHTHNKSGKRRVTDWKG